MLIMLERYIQTEYQLLGKREVERTTHLWVVVLEQVTAGMYQWVGDGAIES